MYGCFFLGNRRYRDKRVLESEKCVKKTRKVSKWGYRPVDIVLKLVTVDPLMKYDILEVDLLTTIGNLRNFFVRKLPGLNKRYLEKEV